MIGCTIFASSLSLSGLFPYVGFMVMDMVLYFNFIMLSGVAIVMLIICLGSRRARSSWVLCGVCCFKWNVWANGL